VIDPNINGVNDELILAARLLLATPFLIFGWRKLRDFSGTVSQMVYLARPRQPLGHGSRSGPIGERPTDPENWQRIYLGEQW